MMNEEFLILKNPIEMQHWLAFNNALIEPSNPAFNLTRECIDSLIPYFELWDQSSLFIMLTYMIKRADKSMSMKVISDFYRENLLDQYGKPIEEMLKEIHNLTSAEKMFESINFDFGGLNDSDRIA